MKRYRRSRHAECVIFFVLALSMSSIGIALSQPPAPSPSKAGQPPQTESAKGEQPSAAYQRGTEKSPLVIKVLPTPKSEAEASRDAHDREEKTTTDRWQIYINGFLALFNFALVVSTVLLWRVTKKAADAAKQSADTLKATERPRFFFTFQKKDFGPFRNSTKTYGTTNKTERPVLNWHIQNFGRQPGVLRKVKIGSGFSPHPISLEEIEPPIQVVGPQSSSDDKSVPFRNWEVSQAQINGLKDGSLFFWFAALLEYENAGSTYETEILWRYTMENGKHLFVPFDTGGRNRNT